MNSSELFKDLGNDPIDYDVSSECLPWHSKAKEYLQMQYNKYSRYLDTDFDKKLSCEFLNRSWELTLINYLHKSGFDLHENFGEKNQSKPDFCFSIDNQVFYLEATLAGAGDAKNYPGLNLPINNLLNEARKIPVDEYRARINSAFKSKALDKYNDRINEKNNGFVPGYNKVIKENGFIIAISMSGISPLHHPGIDDYILSCFFPFGAHKTILLQPTHNSYNFKGIRYNSESSYIKPSYNKKESQVDIDTDYFSNEKYSYISAVLISHQWQIFFSDKIIDGGTPCINSKNDFILIHNPFAKVPIPSGKFNVSREYPLQTKKKVKP